MFARVLLWGDRRCQFHHAPGTVWQPAWINADLVFAGQLVNTGEKCQQPAVPLSDVAAVEADAVYVAAGLQLQDDLVGRRAAVS